LESRNAQFYSRILFANCAVGQREGSSTSALEKAPLRRREWDPSAVTFKRLRGRNQSSWIGIKEGTGRWPGHEVSMLVYAMVLFTILSALGLGIFAGYAAILAILKIFSERKERKSQVSLGAAAMESSGD